MGGQGGSWWTDEGMAKQGGEEMARKEWEKEWERATEGLESEWKRSGCYRGFPLQDLG
jgi:hypothetical protein